MEGEDLASRRAKLLPLLAVKVRDKTADEVFHGLARRRVVCGKLASPADLLADEHLAARSFFRTLHHPHLGDLPFAGAPATLGRTGAVAPAPAPRADEKQDAPELDWSHVETRASGSGEADGLPLAGVRIVDLTQAWIGPFAVMLLADLGADVVKVESHNRPDVWRRWVADPFPANENAAVENSSPLFNSVNRNKRSLCLDLKTAEGLGLLRRLIGDADCVLENYTPRVMSRFGLEWQNLAKTNPGLVMTSWSGFGKTGPLSDYKANGTSIEALAGWDWLHRYPDGEPMVMGFYQADAICGLQMAATTLVALFHSRRTGEGQAVDGSMLEAATGYLGEVLLDVALGGEQTPPGNGDPDHAPHGVYPCAGDDRWIALAVDSDESWRRLAAMSGREALADPAFDRHPGRMANSEKLDEALAEWTRAEQAEHLMERLQAAGVAASVVRFTPEVMACGHLERRGWFRRIDHPDMGEHRYNGHPWRFAGLPERSDSPPPRLGEHSREVLLGRLSLSEAEIDDLFERGVTGAVLTYGR